MKKHNKILSYVLVISFLISLFPNSTFARVLKIKAIKNINSTVYINTNYSLPKMVDVTMSDNTTQKVAVTWNPKTVITSKVGNFSYKGIVKGYEKKVLLTLKVVALPKHADTNTSTSVVKDTTTIGGISETPQTQTYDDPELARAVSLGIGAYKTDNPIVTYEQFFKMLDNVVKIADALKLTAWKATLTDARKSKDSMTRYDGMFSLFLAAEALGGDYIHFTTDWVSTNNKIGEPWNDIHLDLVFSSYYGQKVTFESYTWGYDATAYFYSFGRTSLYSGKTIFDYDPASNTMRPSEPLTYTEALMAALRLYDSSAGTFKVTQRWPTDADKSILNKAEEKKQEILNSPTSVTVKGTKYYVSNNGDDNNTGLTPENAWATLKRVNDANYSGMLHPGDGVFFERGGLWRGELRCANGVTYSAYGTGEKPKLYGSPENGTGAGKWILWYNKNDKKIWKFYHDISDCGNIVFNDGEGYANRVFSYWNGKQAVSVSDQSHPFDIVEGLEYDLQFYSTFDDIGKYKIPFWVHDVDSRGPIYLRCDKGNPGELYKSIEFQSSVGIAAGYTGIVVCGGNNIIDNLCVMYRSTIGLDRTFTDNNTFQNCEVAWIGGGSHIIGYNDGYMNYVPTSGECIRMEGNNNTTKNCYVHDSFDGGVTVEFDAGVLPKDFYYKNMTITGNVIERCMSGISVGDHNQDPNARSTFGNITISDNYILYSGYVWSCDSHYDFTWGSQDYDGNAITFWDGPSINDGISVKNNVLYTAKFSLIHMGMDGKNKPHFLGNTYVQNNNGILAYMRGDDGITLERYIAMSDNKNVEICTIGLGDTTATVLPISVKP